MAEPKEKSGGTHSLLAHIVAGSLSGITATLATHPLDVIQSRTQFRAPGARPLPSSIPVALYDIARHEGAGAVFKGVAPPLAVQTVRFSVVFGAASLARNAYAGWTGTEPGGGFEGKPLGSHIAAGTVAGLSTCFMMAAADNVKLSMQTDETRRGGRSAVSTLGRIYGERGVFKGVLRGSLVTAVRDVPGFCLYFSLSEVAIAKGKSLWNEHRLTPPLNNNDNDSTDSKGKGKGNGNGTCAPDSRAPPWIVAASGGAAGMCTWMILYPVDLLKTNFQLHTEHRSVRETARSLYAEGGAKRFFRGFRIVVYRGFPSNAINYVVFRTVADWLEKRL